MSSFMCRISVLYAIYRTVFPGYRQVVILNAGIVVICVLFAIFMPKIGTIIRFRWGAVVVYLSRDTVPNFYLEFFLFCSFF